MEVPNTLLDWLGARPSPCYRWALSRLEGELFVEVGGEGTAASLNAHPWPA